MIIKPRNFLNGVVWLNQIFCLLGIWIQPILAETVSEIAQRSEALMRGKTQIGTYQMHITSSDWQRLNSQSIKPVSDYKKDRASQDSRLRQGIIEKQHHEIRQCIFRVPLTDNARKAYLFCSNFEIDRLKVDQKINYQEWTGESLSTERREDYEIYHQLVKGVMEEIGFYATHFQSNPELMRQLVEDHDLSDKMEHLIQHSQYGKSFVKLNGEKVRKDLKQIIEKLKLTESRMHIYRDWRCVTWMKIYSSNPNALKKLELSNYRIY